MSITQARNLTHQLRSISVKFCAAQTDPANAAENLLTEALRLLEIAEQFHKDTRVSAQKPSESPLFLSDFSVTSSGSGHLSDNEVTPTYSVGVIQSVNRVQTVPQPTILVCCVGEHESACQVSNVVSEHFFHCL
jgi:hypothetical protein